MLIYTLLGPSAEQGFTRSWGVSYGIGAAAEWQDMAKEAGRGILILVILETLMLTRQVSWLEEHIDYLSCAALLLRAKRLSLYQQTRLFFTYRSRISD